MIYNCITEEQFNQAIQQLFLAQMVWSVMGVCCVLALVVAEIVENRTGRKCFKKVYKTVILPLLVAVFGMLQGAIQYGISP